MKQRPQRTKMGKWDWMNVMDELRILYACLTAKENIKNEFTNATKSESRNRPTRLDRTESYTFG